MTKPSFRQPIRHGKDTGVPHTTSLGNAIVSQRATVSAAFSSLTQIARLPSDTEGGAIASDVYEFTIHLLTAQTPASGGADCSFEVGTSSDPTYFGRIKVTAAGKYTMNAGASAGGQDKWFNVSGIPIYAKISAAGSGGAVNGTGFITTHYIPR